MSAKLAKTWAEAETVGNTESAEKRDPRIRFFKPSEIRAFVPDENSILVGEQHVMRGGVFVIGGEPGVGKSTAATELAVCGATGRDWLGLPVHCRFKTLIIQNENGRFRLKQEYDARGLGDEIDDFVRVSEPPPFGMTLNHPEFLADVKAVLEDFRPDLVIFDPWNAAAKDDKAADYSAAFDSLRAMLPTGNDKPALGIVAHTRKPKSDEQRTGGSSLMHLLAGSYVLSSVPRAVFIMVPGSHDETDNAVVWFNPKNNDGMKIERSAWERGPEGFKQIPDFDWTIFDSGGGGRKMLRLEDIREALASDSWKRSEAVKRLMGVSECGRRACEKALAENGKFAADLKFDGDFVGVKA